MDRKKQIEVLMALWFDANPDPEPTIQIIRECINDFVESGFDVDEIKEGIRLYRRDYPHQRRHFGFLWSKVMDVRRKRLNLPDAPEAYAIAKRFKNDHAFTAAKDVTEEMLEPYCKDKPFAVDRLLAMIHSLGWEGLFTDNEVSDRARFIQAYEVIDKRISDKEVWATPDRLLPEGEPIPIEKLLGEMTNGSKTETD